MATLLLKLAALGFLILLLQRLALAFAQRRPPPVPTRFPALSILKPLCGVEDQLEENLGAFAALN